MGKKYAYHGGKIVETGKISVNPYDLGFLRGYGVFDVMCTANGKPFMLDDHWKRLQLSAETLGLKIPVAKKVYAETVRKLLKIHGYKKANIRTVLSGGLSSDAFTPEGRSTFLIMIEDFQALPAEVYSKGASLITLEYERDFPEAKSINYVAAIRNLPAKQKAGALEQLYVKDGMVSEASTSNFFYVKKGVVYTAKSGVLGGITKKLVIRLAKNAGIRVVETDIRLKAVMGADEAFLSATNKDIVPIVKVDGKKIGDGKVGKNTKILMEKFRRFVEKY